MKRVQVSSSAVATVGYDQQSRTLEVEYVSGEVYRYLDVDPARVLALLEAESIGRFVNERIKPHHRHVHVGTA